MISNSRKRNTNISPEGFAHWILSADENVGSRDTINKKKSQQIRIHCKRRFASISGSNNITQDVSDGENETKKAKGAQVIEKSNLDRIYMTQTQNKRRRLLKKENKKFQEYGEVKVKEKRTYG